jgi:putative phosphoribosyl transferase
MCQISPSTTMTFASRTEAGQQLGRYLAGQHVQPDLVLGLPRGGVIVAVEVADILKCPLDALVVRKVGHPGHREFAVGALAEDGTLVLD